MDEVDILNILEELDDGEFENFKWYLKKESWNGISAIKAGQLMKAERRNIVDLMAQKFKLDGAVQVMLSVLKKISRNDLVKEVQAAASKHEDSVPEETLDAPAQAQAQAQAVTSEAKLASRRSEFVDRVSNPVLLNLLDKLLDQGVITDHEMESARTFNRAEKARHVIDMVRKKGSRASSALIAALNEVDPCLSEHLNLK